MTGTYESYASEVETPRFTDWLRERSGPAWSEAVEHRFTRELRAGTIADEVFGRYLLEDYAFLESLVGAVGRAVGDAPTMAAKSRLAAFLGGLTAEENDYFERAFEAVGIDAETRAEWTAGPTTRAFEDLLGRATREGGYAETLAVLVPAEWIYLEWASAGGEPSRPYLAEWIDLHADPEFEEFVGWLRGQLDREGERASKRRRERIEGLFARTVELEAAFFEAAYESGGERAW